MRTKTLMLLCTTIAIAPGRPVSAQQRDPIADLASFRYGADRTVLDAAYSWVVQSATHPTTRKQAATRLAGLLASSASVEAKQQVCRLLARVAGPEQVPALARQIASVHLYHYAVMALERIPGKESAAALRRAARSTTGLARIEIVNALGDRRDTQGVPLVASLLTSGDIAETEAAAEALGKIASPAAVKALSDRFGAASGPASVVVGRGIVAAAASLRRAGARSMAAQLCDAVASRTRDRSLQAAALQGTCEAVGAAATPRLLKALREPGSPRQWVALGYVRSLPGTAVTAQFAASLATLPPAVQRPLIEALRDRGDRSAAPGIARLVGSADTTVAVSAITALGSLGTASAIPALLMKAGTGAPVVRSAARDALARLRGKAVDTALLRSATTAPSAVRAEAITALGSRNLAAALPILMSAARATDRLVSAAALRVLRIEGQPEHIPVLLDGLTSADDVRRDDILGAVSGIARRGTSETGRTGALTDRLAMATTSRDRCDLLGLLGELGGPSALSRLREALGDAEPSVRSVAVAQLSEWPATDPMPQLLEIARNGAAASDRAIALRGFTRMVSMGARPARVALGLYKEAASLARTQDDRRVVLSGLSSLRTAESLDFASTFMTDPEVRTEAEACVVKIAAATIGSLSTQTRSALKPIAESRSDLAKQASALLAAVDSFGDFVMGWEHSPAYQQDGANYAALFDIAFPPEIPERSAEVPWQLLPVGGSPDQPWLLDLLAVWGGEQKVAYLRTALTAEEATDVILELGSDDGIKVWWNGRLVHTNNTARAVAPAQEQVRLTTIRGRNHLMVKVTQNVMGWGLCARFSTPDGAPVTGLRVDLSGSD